MRQLECCRGIFLALLILFKVAIDIGLDLDCITRSIHLWEGGVLRRLLRRILLHPCPY
jgi:hypothetical protein